MTTSSYYKLSRIDFLAHVSRHFYGVKYIKHEVYQTSMTEKLEMVSHITKNATFKRSFLT